MFSDCGNNERVLAAMDPHRYNSTGSCKRKRQAAAVRHRAARASSVARDARRTRSVPGDRSSTPGHTLGHS